jgi:hypothetical protein
MAIALAAALPSAAGEPARSDGSVVDARTGRPLAATVTIADAAGRQVHVATDRSGRFAALGFEAGTLVVAIAADGYVGTTVACEVPSGEAGRFEFRLYRAVKTISNTSVRAPLAPFHCALEPDTEDKYIIR